MQENIIISALMARLEAERMEALAVLNVYTTSPVGVGEHPSFLAEAAKALKNLESAVSQLETLNIILQNSNEQQEKD